MLKNLLMYRFGVFNALMTGLTAMLASKGWVTTILAADFSMISLAIAVLFVLLWGSTVRHIVKTSRTLNALKLKRPVPPQGRKRLVKIAHIHDGAGWLAYLGLIGTVVGFTIALGGVDVGSLATAAGVQDMIPELMGGMKVALYTTLVGAYLGLWTEVNYRMLHTATECVVADEGA